MSLLQAVLGAVALIAALILGRVLFMTRPAPDPEGELLQAPGPQTEVSLPKLTLALPLHASSPPRQVDRPAHGAAPVDPAPREDPLRVGPEQPEDPWERLMQKMEREIASTISRGYRRIQGHIESSGSSLFHLEEGGAVVLESRPLHESVRSALRASAGGPYERMNPPERVRPEPGLAPERQEAMAVEIEREMLRIREARGEYEEALRRILDPVDHVLHELGTGQRNFCTECSLLYFQTAPDGAPMSGCPVCRGR